MEAPTRRNFAKALIAAPVMAAAGAFTVNAQETVKPCCGPSPVATYIHESLVTLYREFQHEDTDRVDGLRSLDETLRLWIAYAEEQGTNHILATTLRGINRQEAVAYVMSEGPARSTAKLHETLPEANFAAQPIDRAAAEYAYDLLASGGYTQLLTKFQRYSERKLILRMTRLGLVSRDDKIRGLMSNFGTCMPEHCKELQGDIATANAAIAILCGLCYFVPPDCILCTGMLMLRGWMEIQWAGQCVMMNDPETCREW